MNKDLLIERIELLCKERKIKPTTAYIESGVGKNFKSNLNIANPTLGKIILLAEYFNVSREYLLGETDEKKPTTADELDDEILMLYSQLPPDKRKQADDYLRFLVQNSKQNEDA
jgi:transcriptional regulator with XRE-family HTH domain